LANIIFVWYALAQEINSIASRVLSVGFTETDTLEISRMVSYGQNCISYSLEMSLQFVFGVVGLSDPGVEVVVDLVEVAPHHRGTFSQTRVYLAAQLLR